MPLNPLLVPIPAGQTDNWWLIEPSATVFENIGISKAVDGIGKYAGYSQPPITLLIFDQVQGRNYSLVQNAI